jgi:hypothetical protein
VAVIAKTSQFPSDIRTRRTMALLQYDIIYEVLSHCVGPYDANPLAIHLVPIPCRGRFKRFPLRVPIEAAWFATGARTCKAWLDPALRYLYRTLFLRRVQVPTDIIERIGHRVRNLCIAIDSNDMKSERPNIPFKHFTVCDTRNVRPIELEHV